MSIFDQNLERNVANHQPLTPLGFLSRAALIHPRKTAVVDWGGEGGRERRFTYAELYERARRLASALAGLGVERGQTVSYMGPNSTALLEAHYGVPMCGGVLNALNYRLDAATIAFILEHAETRVLLTDREYSPVVAEALSRLGRTLPVIDVEDPEGEGGERLGSMDYEALLADGDPDFEWLRPLDEWDAITLNYTSGTTGNPKGVVYHHRGAFLNAMGNTSVFGVSRDSVYLWTLPMFHCNGWTYTWGVTAVGGTHVVQRNVRPAQIFARIASERVTHMCGAPTVLNMLANAPPEERTPFSQTVEIATGGASPPSAVIAAMEQLGFRVTHLYGLTEVYGPATWCAWQDEWAELPLEERARLMARQGVPYPTITDLVVADPATCAPLPADGESMGEVLMRGSTVMKGYLKNPRATEEAFAGGWFHSGDLAVMHPDGYIEIKDRAKDIIISGGENISSLEIEEVLYRHPAVLEAAVVAAPDPHWGETPCAFVALKPGSEGVDAEALTEWCRAHLARFKVPRRVVFGELPKTNTGKIQKFLLRERAREA